jgi:hypothetical protein
VLKELLQWCWVGRGEESIGDSIRWTCPIEDLFDETKDSAYPLTKKHEHWAILHSRRIPRGILRRLLDYADAAAAENSSNPFGGRLVIELGTNCVTLDGTPYLKIDPDAVRALDVLRDAGGKPTSMAKLRAKVPNCNHDTTFGRWLDKLPRPLRACVKAKTGSGIWLELPPIS